MICALLNRLRFIGRLSSDHVAEILPFPLAYFTDLTSVRTFAAPLYPCANDVFPLAERPASPSAATPRPLTVT